MELQELIQTVQKFELLCQRLTQQKLAGLFNSSFKGRGWSIDHIRKYEVGDNIKDIEWNVTARFRETFVKTFTQEKERLVWLLVDVSRSMLPAAPGQGRGKYEVALEISAALAFSAIESQDQVGVVFFSDKVEHVVPAARGKVHFWRIAKELVAARPASRATSVAAALQFLINSHAKSSVVFLVSDFVSEDYATASQVLAQQHELVAIRVAEEREAQVPKLGWVQLRDAETGRTRWQNTSAAGFHQRLEQHHEQVAGRFEEAYGPTAVRSLTVGTAGKHLEELIGFLQHAK
ncbi:DUF58 domain-containing protein [Hymenobacter sp. 5317J-9]|uniref:DUF58 domain-containing protein n=1 Tax=Hymenobacter sp. 5317J-9 TaxID=2932250 RepID=UPI001FD71E70|nr:DUF58 domain-containing protein [Hymenobacter sp. 5317J-9]UOQ96711.1 DUF58 domain-containing protein [Hymenobacter sp. 5317J-9]